MAGIITFASYTRFLDRWATAGIGGFELRLFQNDFTPLRTSLVGAFTPCDYGGYLAGVPVFSAAAIGGDDKGAIASGPHVFAYTGGDTNVVYGWYLVDVTPDVVCAAKRFDSAPRSMAEIGDIFTINLLVKDVQN